MQRLKLILGGAVVSVFIIAPIWIVAIGFKGAIDEASAPWELWPIAVSIALLAYSVYYCLFQRR